MRRRHINQQRDKRKQQAGKTRTRHGHFVSDFSSRTKFVFCAKRLGNFLAADNNLRGRKWFDRLPLAASVPHGQSPVMFMDGLCLFAVVGTASNQAELVYVWTQATPEAKAIIVFLIFFSIVAWSTMFYKAVQMRRARKLNYYFEQEFRSQKKVLDIFDRKLQVEGCPLYEVYQTGCVQLDARLRGPGGERRQQTVSLKNMEHVKRAMENVVAQESLKLESGLILLAIAVSGAPFIGLLGTVWGVMSAFAGIAQSGSATLAAMAPGVAAALITTVAGLLVAIPSMFGYNYLVHNLRAFTVGLDNFAQELVSKMESEFLEDS
jgi:biopolymer transport protein ExbB/TolQ